MDAELLRARVRERLAATGKGPVTVSDEIGKGRDYLSDFLNGKKSSLAKVIPQLAEALECSRDYLMDASAGDEGPRAVNEVLIPIRGYVGASPDGRIQFSTGDAPNEFALMPPGGTSGSIALKVNGHSMRGIADNGSLIFYEETRTPPTPDMLGHVVVVATESGDVLVKRLLKGSNKGVFDLESIGAETLPDQRLKWAAHIVSIVPPHRARQILKHMAA